MTEVTQFKIDYTGFINSDGELTQTLPADVDDINTIKALYR